MGTLKSQYFYFSRTWSNEYPDMSPGRFNHACGMVTFGGKEVFVISGGTNDWTTPLTDINALDLNNPSIGWNSIGSRPAGCTTMMNQPLINMGEENVVYFACKIQSATAFHYVRAFLFLTLTIQITHAYTKNNSLYISALKPRRNMGSNSSKLASHLWKTIENTIHLFH